MHFNEKGHGVAMGKPGQQGLIGCFEMTMERCLFLFSSPSESKFLMSWKCLPF